MKARFELNKYRLYANMMKHVDSSMYTYNAFILNKNCVILFARS